MSPIELCVIDCGIRINCLDSRARSLIEGGYSWFRRAVQTPDLSYEITPGPDSDQLSIRRESADGDFLDQVTGSDADFLYVFEKDLVIETQKLRSDLFFVHAAVVELNGVAFALVGPSGSGKSTATWGLLHEGFNYLSDELAPIDLTTIRVHPFPRALCLKGSPPKRYPLPKETARTSFTSHIPLECLSAVRTATPIPLSTLIFLQYSVAAAEPILKPLAKAAAAARLFASSLNALAHPSNGLDAVVEVVSKTFCFDLVSSELKSTCGLIRKTCGAVQETC